MNRSLLNKLAKYVSIIRNYVLSASLQRKYSFYYQNTFLDAFRTNSRNIIGRNPSMVIPLLANEDLTPMLQLLRTLEDPQMLLRNKFVCFSMGKWKWGPNLTEFLGAPDERRKAFTCPLICQYITHYE